MAFRWSQAISGNKGTGFHVGGFMQSTEKLMEKLKGSQKKKITEFKKLCFEALRRIMVRTPVDTGTARASWTLRFDEESAEVVKAAIVNSTHYAIYLEYGHSKQAPKGMVRITLAELAQEIRNR